MTGVLVLPVQQQSRQVVRMADPVRRGSPAEAVGLALLAVAPLLFLASLAWARTGNNLEQVLLVGSAVFLAAGLILSVAGVWQDRPGRLRGGVALSASALLAAVAGKFE